jgi:Ca-activated chloride channel family protein
MTFATPALLVLLPAVGLIALWRLRRPARRAALVVAELEVARAASKLTWRTRLRWLPAGMRLAAIALLIVAAARPQQGLALTPLPEEGIDIVVALDVSSSMITFTVGGDENRLEAARRVVTEFVNTLEGNRVGLVAFQSRALTLSPLTLDHVAITRQVRGLRSGLIDDGTAIGLGLMESLALLESSPARSKVIVLLTDGQNNVPGVDPLVAARIAETLDVRVYTIGFIGQSAFGGAVDSFTLRQMAEATGGQFFDARTREDLEDAYATIGSLERSRIGERPFTLYREFAPWVAAAALALLVADATLRSTWLRRHP